MKKIINGLTYNTATASKIAAYETPGGRLGDDSSVVREVLYKTPKGRYFLFGRGFVGEWGAVQYGGGVGFGSGIRALTESEARAWIERREIDPEDVADEFSFEDA